LTTLVTHPHRDLMLEAQREREIADSPEGRTLRPAITKAMFAYSDFIQHEGVIWDDEDDDPDDPDYRGYPRLKAQALIAVVDFGKDAGTSVNIFIKDGALDRVYGNGTNPDPDGLGPADIPHAERET
jgi:hypothetical protein